MHPIGYIRHRHLILRPMREERLENSPTDLPMQPTHAIHRDAAPRRQETHIECSVMIIVPITERKELLQRNLCIFQISTKVPGNHLSRKTIEPRPYRSVTSEDITSPHCTHSHRESFFSFCHEITRSFHDRKRSMSFIQMTNLPWDFQRS